MYEYIEIERYFSINLHSEKGGMGELSLDLTIRKSLITLLKGASAE